VGRANDLLSGEAELQGQSLDEEVWTIAMVPPVVVEEPEEAKEEQVEQVPFNQNHIERMGPEMREKIILQLLVKAIRQGDGAWKGVEGDGENQ
jgi:hypothetical protein